LFNVNADTLAANLAGRLKSPRLVVAGATAGVLDGSGGTIAELSFGDIESLLARGGATAGMIAKLSACRHAVEGGARDVFIADGRDASALAVLARYGRAPGAATSTRIDNAKPTRRRHMKRKAS
jgi:acetylglutamate kinase